MTRTRNFILQGLYFRLSLTTSPYIGEGQGERQTRSNPRKRA